jgi:hypothetical protein
MFLSILTTIHQRETTLLTHLSTQSDGRFSSIHRTINHEEIHYIAIYLPTTNLSAQSGGLFFSSERAMWSLCRSLAASAACSRSTPLPNTLCVGRKGVLSSRGSYRSSTAGLSWLEETSLAGTHLVLASDWLPLFLFFALAAFRCCGCSSLKPRRCRVTASGSTAVSSKAR